MKNKKLFAILTLVCFMFTLMPVAAFAAPVADTSAFVAVKGDQTLHKVGTANGTTTAEFVFRGNNNAGGIDGTVAPVLYIWAVDANGVRTSALNVAGLSNYDSTVAGPQYVAGFTNVANDARFELSFARAGVYKVYAGFAPNAVTSMDDITVLNSGSTFSTITVVGTSSNPESEYAMQLDGKAGHLYTYEGADFQINNVTPNNVGVAHTLTFWDGANLLTGKTVTLETSSANIAVNKATATINALGQVNFDLSASREGTYELYVTVDGVTFIVEVSVGNTAAAYIKTIAQPAAAKAQYAGLPTVRFQVTDINGNVVQGNGTAVPTDKGMEGIRDNIIEAGKYVSFTEKPAASTLTNNDLTLSYNADKQAYDLSVGGKIMDAEGTYSVKVILDNGAFATATWEVKKFQTPVQLRADYERTTVELGGNIAPDQIVFVDANGVEKVAKNGEIDFAATGYAIYDLEDANDCGAAGNTINDANIVVKTDEKYVGSAINVTVVSERYDLVATVALKVADEAKDIAFADKTADVNVNNKIAWNVVDSQGNKVALKSGVANTAINYVVLDKPEGAKVSIYDATINGDLQAKGEGKMALTSDKVGNVTVQVVLKAEYAVDNDGAEKTQVKYYTGTQIFAVGTESVGDVVVMSIGSNEIVKNDKVATMIAAPIVQNDRTFVPFRALAEAFGAEVAWDEATQAVTAELNGVTVVMTIGSVEYTINGEAATMDVAPFLGNDSTMVPVRFVAQAFGIKVIPTYDANGATADILFNL